MPTIDIPDRICPHCGGIRWYIAYRKGKNPQYTCFVLLREREKKRYFANPEPYKKRSRERTAKIWITKDPGVVKKIYTRQYNWRINNLDKVKLYRKKSEEKIRRTMTDEYVKRLITQLVGYENFTFKNIPQKLIDRKREQLLLTRQLRQLEK